MRPIAPGARGPHSSAVRMPNNMLPQGSYSGNPPGREAPLGTLTKTVTPPQQKRTTHSERRASRWSLRASAGKLLPDERVSTCGHFKSITSEGVAIHYDETKTRASYHDVSVCGSVWACPVCAANINTYRRNELSGAIKKAESEGMGVYLVTLTIQHSRADSLADLVEVLKDSWRRVKRGAPWLRISEEFGFVGYVTATEATYGDNGWHPHLHALLFTESRLTDYGIDRLESVLKARYMKMVLKNGGYASAEHSVDVRGGNEASDYITKWGLESELTGIEYKESHGVYSGYTPFELLALYNNGGNSWAGKLFSEWALTMKGRRQLVWARGLRDVLCVGDDIQDIDAASDMCGSPLAYITVEQWRALWRAKVVLYVLEQIESSGGSVAPLWGILDVLGVPMSELNTSMFVRYLERHGVNAEIRKNERNNDMLGVEYIGRGLLLTESYYRIDAGDYVES